MSEVFGLEDLVSVQQNLETLLQRGDYRSIQKDAIDRLKENMSKDVVLVYGLFGGLFDMEGLEIGKFRFTTSAWKEADIVVIGSNNAPTQFGVELLNDIAENRPHVSTCVWLIDHHHNYAESIRLCNEYDFCVPAHYTRTDYLRCCSAVVLPTVPCGTEQWSVPQMQNLFNAFGDSPRSNNLYGGFRMYPQFDRNKFIADVTDALPSSHKIYLRSSELPRDQDTYFSLNGDERFNEWLSHKVSLSVSVNQDIPMRIFDALSAGQIPLVATEICNLEALFPIDVQRRLPIVRYIANDVESALRAYATALSLFDAGGFEAARHRHEIGVGFHQATDRLITTVSALSIVSDAV